MPFLAPFIPAITAATAVAGTVAGISAQRTAAKRAKSQAQQAERVRAEERKRLAITPAKPVVTKPPTIERAEALPEVAKKEAAAIAAGRKRRRRTLVTGPRGLLTEPTVTRPALLGA